VARDVAGIPRASSSEFDERTPDPIISTMADQEDIVAGKGDMGGTMRLGSYVAKLTPGSLVAEAYGTTEVTERHRHRYEVNNAYRAALAQAGPIISGTSPDGKLVEFVEMDRDAHPYFVATQAHPELKSRPTRPHPLFSGLVGASIAYAQADQLPGVSAGV
jgi:CTP synthase